MFPTVYGRGVTAAPKTAVRDRLNFGLSLIAKTAILGAAIANAIAHLKNLIFKIFIQKFQNGNLQITNFEKNLGKI